MEYEKIVLKIWTILSAIGGFLMAQLGGWDKALYALVSLMAVDFILGIMKGFAGKSDKSESGKLSSEAGRNGLFKKMAMLLCVFIACVLDLFLDSNFIRECVILAFCIPEIVSIIENLQSLGVPIPPVFHKVIELMYSKVKVDDKKNEK